MLSKLDDYVYRARGIYKTNNRPTWITNSWKRTLAEAEEDIRIYGANNRYSNTTIHKLNWVEFANKNRRLPRGLR